MTGLGRGKGANQGLGSSHAGLYSGDQEFESRYLESCLW